MSILEKIKNVTKQLLPTGRAWRIPIGGVFQKLLDGLHASEARAVEDAISIHNSALPDNDNFTAEDASAWEKRLGLITNASVALADRKLAISRKMAHPGLIPARQNYLYLEGQLRAAGFDVYVYENRFADYYAGYVTKTPAEFSVIPFPTVDVQHAQFIQHGDIQHGWDYSNKVANNVVKFYDDYFNVGLTFRSTFFVGGPTPGSWAIVDANREQEFRQLILRTKPAQMVGYLLVVFY